jgi:hypothetical protein
VGVFHKCRVFHFLSSDGVNSCDGLVLLGTMVIPEGYGHVESVHAIEGVLGQVAGREIMCVWAPSEVVKYASLV